MDEHPACEEVIYIPSEGRIIEMPLSQREAIQHTGQRNSEPLIQRLDMQYPSGKGLKARGS